MSSMLIGLLVIILAQMALIAFLLRQAAQERANLLQRIQAPEIAVVRHDMGNLPPDPPELPFDDDEAFNESRDALAARLASFEANPV